MTKQCDTLSSYTDSLYGWGEYMYIDIEDLKAAVLSAVETETLKRLNEMGNEGFEIPVGISNHHIHLTRKDIDVCFGKGHQLTPIKELSQPGQFACEETVTICGPKGAIEKIRVLGPERKATQVELFVTDNFKLGIKAPLRLSGDLEASAPITIVGPKGSVYKEEAAIVAQRHIHMTLQDAEHFGVNDGDNVLVMVKGERGGILNNVIIRANDTSKLDFHIDTEEANAVGLSNGSKVRLIKK